MLEQVMNEQVDYISSRPLLLSKLTICGHPNADQGTCTFTFVVENGSQVMQRRLLARMQCLTDLSVAGKSC